MGRAIVVRTDYTSGDVRRVAQRVKMRRRYAGCLRSRRCSTAARLGPHFLHRLPEAKHAVDDREFGASGAGF